MDSNRISDLVSSIRRPGHLSECEAYCTTHGKYIAILDNNTNYVSDCPVCRELIYEQERKKEFISNRIENLKSYANIPKRYANKGLHNYECLNDKHKRQLEQIKSYVQHYRPDMGTSIILSGRTGTGKTHLAIGIIHELINKLVVCKYATFANLIEHIKQSFETTSKISESDVIAIYTQCDVLILDELGLSELTSFESQMLYKVINTRYENMMPTIVISNLTISELKNTLDDRVIDRLRENGGFAIEFNQESYRK